MSHEPRPDIRARLDFLAGGIKQAVQAARASDGLSPQVKGGMVNGWKRHARAEALMILTSYALIQGGGAVRPGRENVRAWQVRVFGRSLSRQQLARWAEAPRFGGGRGTPVVLPARVEARVARLFADFCQRVARM